MIYEKLKFFISVFVSFAEFKLADKIFERTDNEFIEVNDDKKTFSKIAVLIGSENSFPSDIDNVIRIASEYGKITIMRAYADWTGVNSVQWKSKFEQFRIKAIHQPHYAAGKNSSGIAILIDAMDLLHEQKADAIAIVSSDSDFTALAIRLRESGIYVIGFGKSNTAPAFRQACNEFHLLGQPSKNSSTPKIIFSIPGKENQNEKK